MRHQAAPGRVKHALRILAVHLRQHPNLPGRYVACTCDLCRWCRDVVPTLKEARPPKW